ncbi:MAG: arginine--tRNA ligase [Hyphomicrobiaceae bacterium TMED74]|nr:arginine--tRNA ligase [Filomicrobium sp.]RPG39641.1 MAG: arginine--tRNA ligase [Hyphomicrobiaceae bacterium TMED74]
MNIFALAGEAVRQALLALQQEGRLAQDIELSGLDIQEPRDPSHGDLASNAAMVLAKRAKAKPRDLAQLIADKLLDQTDFTKADVAGPGFINLTLSGDVWCRLISTVLANKTTYGQSELGKGKSAQVEYVSANPTGPMHIGHCRGAVFGDTLANLLAFAGYDVSREYYMNDAGAQVDKLGQSALLRYREALGETIGEIPEGLYPGEYMKAIGQVLVERYGNSLLDMPTDEALDIARSSAIEALLSEIKNDLAALNVQHDVFFSERSLSTAERDQVAEAIELLRKKSLIYEGRLPKPLGHEDDEWEDREQTLFRSADFGDDMDRALKKSDGSYTYFANDVAYHLNKIERGFSLYFNVLGADHVGYIPRLKAVVEALSDNSANFETPVTQLVKVLRDGQPVRMSKRAGTFVALRDVVDEVGSDPVRFMMMMRKHDSPLDFDLAKVVEQSKDNAVFYVQYAHARAESVFRVAAETFPELTKNSDSVRNADLTLLYDVGERALIREIARFPRVVESAAREREPHRVPFYLYDLASAFHHQWARGNDLPQLRFSQIDNVKVTASRLALVLATQKVISSGLHILGVQAPLEMR